LNPVQLVRTYDRVRIPELVHQLHVCGGIYI
jgi:hypothetical protein